MAGMSIDDADVVKSSIVINNNTKTTNIKTTTGTSKLQPCGTSFSDTIQLEPYVSTNNDHIYIESTNKNVATVSFVPGADNRNASLQSTQSVTVLLQSIFTLLLLRMTFPQQLKRKQSI